MTPAGSAKLDSELWVEKPIGALPFVKHSPGEQMQKARCIGPGGHDHSVMVERESTI